MNVKYLLIAKDGISNRLPYPDRTDFYGLTLREPRGYSLDQELGLIAEYLTRARALLVFHSDQATIYQLRATTDLEIEDHFELYYGFETDASAASMVGPGALSQEAAHGGSASWKLEAKGDRERGFSVVTSSVGLTDYDALEVGLWLRADVLQESVVKLRLDYFDESGRRLTNRSIANITIPVSDWSHYRVVELKENWPESAESAGIGILIHPGKAGDRPLASVYVDDIRLSLTRLPTP
jgi:hypothetical protein